MKRAKPFIFIFMPFVVFIACQISLFVAVEVIAVYALWVVMTWDEVSYKDFKRKEVKHFEQ